jgi:HAD superfamily hydrolase (TIGR01484 family)
MEKLVIFDLDGTLAESKSSLDGEMISLLKELLHNAKVAVISGGDWPQFQKQLLVGFSNDSHLTNLSILPTCGTKYYSYTDGVWNKLYSEDLSTAEKDKIIRSFDTVLSHSDFNHHKVWGEIIQDRGSQITFSALGQQAPLAEKKKWDPDFAKRRKIKAALEVLIPEFSIRLGGTTSIDITKPGIDKAYGIKKLRDLLPIAESEMIFIGDAIFPGGNDYPAKEMGITTIAVRDPEETKRIIETINACTSKSDQSKSNNK